MCNISSITSKKNVIIPKFTDYLSTSAENVLKSTFARIPSYLAEKWGSPKTAVFNRLFGLSASGNCLLYIQNPLESVILTGIHFLTFCIAILHSNLDNPSPVFQTISWIFTHISLCKAGTRKWNGTGRQYSLLFRKSAVLVIIIKMSEFTK